MLERFRIRKHRRLQFCTFTGSIHNSVEIPLLLVTIQSSQAAAEKSFSAAAFHLLSTYNFTVYGFCCPISYIVHFANPRHWIGSFQLFGNTLSRRQLFYQLLEHFLCLSVDIRKIFGQLAACQQICIDYLVVAFQMA